MGPVPAARPPRHLVRLDPRRAPAPWRLPSDPPATTPDAPPLTQLARLTVGPGDEVHVDGGEPTHDPQLPGLLAAITDAGARAVVHSTLPGFRDDQLVRPWAPFDVRFRVRYPTADALTLAALTDGAASREDLDLGLRNLMAFAYPFDLVVPVTRGTVATLALTVEHLWREYVPGFVHLEVHGGTGDDDPGWAHAPRWGDVAAQLLSLDARRLQPPPRVTLRGLHPLTLPLEQLSRVDVRFADPGAGPVTAPAGYLRVHGALDVDLIQIGTRRAVLALPERDRPAFRGDPLDRLAHVTSLVLIRPGHRVYAAVERERPGVPYLARGHGFGLLVAGRFDEDRLAARFAELARRLHARARAEETPDLARLRALAHVLRRSMSARRDDEPVQLREEHD